MSPNHNSSPPSFSAIAKKILRDLDQHINNPTPTCPGLEDHETLGPEKLMDTRTRFLLWTGNLGVMHKAEDTRALDRRLLDAPEVAGRVRDILGDLQDLLSQSGRPCDCDASQRSSGETIDSMDDEDAMMMQLLGLQTSKKCTTSWLAASLDDTLRRLFHLSSLITKSSTRDKFVRAQVKCRLGTYEYYDIRHVREKVKHASGRADEGLVTRLGKANTSRRQFIAYSHEHNAELSHLDPDDDQESDQRHAKHGMSDKNSIGHSVLHSEITKQSAVPTKASTVGFVDPNAFDYGLDDARSCTTVATSIVDGQAFSGLKVPELAQYAKPGEHFICPLCQTVQRFNGQVAWRRHVFSDIRGYVCTSNKCGMLMFSSFNAWRSHEMDHRREWFCPHCNIVYHDKLKARMHMIQHHDNLDGHHQADLLLQTSSRLPEYLSADDCPLCDWGATLRKHNIASKEHDLTVPSRRFMKHLGRHLEEIALFVVPQPEEDQIDSDDIGSNAVHAAQGEDSSTNSTLSTFDSKIPSVVSTQPRDSLGNLQEESNEGLCPYPTCGRRFRDLKTHILTHQNERPEKCPVPSCEYHAKGFVRIYDRRRHTLTHYKGTMMCGFCPSSVTLVEKSFNRVDVFKRHLSNSHGVEQIPPNARRRAEAQSSSDDIVHTCAGEGSKCSNCGNVFSSAQRFYEHLDDCVLSVIESQLHNNLTTASSAAHVPYKADEIIKEYENSAFQPDASFTVQLVGKPDPITKAYSDDARTQSSASSPRSEEALRSVLGDAEPIMTGGHREDDMKAGFANSDPEKRRGRAAPHSRCHGCNPVETLEWRRGTEGARTICNACGLRHSMFTRKLNNASKDRDRHQDGSSHVLKPQDPISPGFDTTAIEAQHAIATFSQTLGDTIIPISINYDVSSSIRGDLQHGTKETSGSSNLTTSNSEENFQSPPDLNRLDSQQVAVLARQRELRQVEGHQQSRDLGTISPKHAVLGSDNDAPQADTQSALQQPQSQPVLMPQWPSMLNSQSHETCAPYLSRSQRPTLSDFAYEPIAASQAPLDYWEQLLLLEKQSQRRLQMARQEHDSMYPQPGWAYEPTGLPGFASLRHLANNDIHAIRDGSINDFAMQSRSKSFLDEKDEPQQTHGHPLSSQQSFQISPQGNTATAETMPHSNAQGEIEHRSNAHLEVEASMPQNSERFENARLEDTRRPWPSSPVETLAPFERISHAQPPNSWQPEFIPNLPSLSSPKAERLPSIHNILNDRDVLKSEVRLSDTTLAGSANAYDEQLLSQMTAVDTPR